MVSLLTRAIKYQRDNGTLSLISKIYQKSVRRMFPFDSYTTANGVKLPSSYFPYHVKYESYIPFLPSPDEPNAQFGEIFGHQTYTQEGDSVVIVGGGRGISTVIAAKSVGETGSVTVYEPSIKHFGIICEVVKLNGVEGWVNTKNASVGSEIAVGGETPETNISPEELPDCDVLELDCEMAELEILQNLQINPRVIIVEIHNGYQFEGSDILELLEELGYSIVDWIAKNERVTESEFGNVIQRRDNNHHTSKHWESPPIVIATRNGS